MGSYYQSLKYFRGGMKINTRKNNSKHTTHLTATKINSLQKKLSNIDLNSSKETQYKNIKNILSNIDETNFKDEYDQKEISILKYNIEKVLNGKRGSKPSEFINVLEKVLERLQMNGGFYPSVMTGVVGAGKYLVPLALRQGYTLLNNKKKTRKIMRKNNK